MFADDSSTQLRYPKHPFLYPNDRLAQGIDGDDDDATVAINVI